MPFDTDTPDLSRDFGPAPALSLTPKQKAAVVVRLLLSEGAVPALSNLPESKQTELAVQLARMAPVDQATVAAVAEEFADAIENIGLSFPGGLDGALGLLEGVISPSAWVSWICASRMCMPCERTMRAESSGVSSRPSKRSAQQPVALTN